MCLQFGQSSAIIPADSCRLYVAGLRELHQAAVLLHASQPLGGGASVLADVKVAVCQDFFNDDDFRAQIGV